MTWGVLEEMVAHTQTGSYSTPRAPGYVSLEWLDELPTLVPEPPTSSEMSAPRGVVRMDGGAVLSVLGSGADGLHRSVTEVYPLEHDEALDIIGEDGGRPTTFFAVEGGVRLECIGAVPGVFAKIDSRVALEPGDRFLVGMSMLRFEAAQTHPGHDAWGSVVRLREDGWPVQRFEVTGQGARIGRSRGDIVLTHDPFLSHRHCRVFGDGGGVWLEDEGSNNGTFRMVRSGELLPFGTVLRIGDATLRVDPTLA